VIFIICVINYNVHYLCNIIIICNNDDNVVINKNYGRVKDFILLFKILVGTQKNFLKMYSQFEHAPSGGFTSPSIGYWYILFAWAL